MSHLIRVAVFVSFAATALGQPVRTFVSVGGDDTGPCTRPAPCRQFSVAVAAVAAGGEVVALDSGGYGPVTLTKSVALLAEPGAHAAIAPTSGDAITVAAGTSDVVLLRNLYLNAQGGARGVNFTSGAALQVQNLTASGFSEYGIFFNADAEIFVSNSIFRHNNQAGVHVQALTGVARGTLDTVHLNGNGNGSGIGSCGGMTAGENSRVTATRTIAVSNFRGFQVLGNNAQLNLDRSAALNGIVGLFANGNAAVMRVSDSTVSGNTFIGIETQGQSQILSRVNNTVINNAGNENFSGTVVAK